MLCYSVLLLFGGFITIPKNQQKGSMSDQIRMQDELVAWYVMRFAKRNQYHSEQVQTLLDTMQQKGIAVFRPMQEQLCQRGGKLRKSLQPVLGDLFFAKGSRQQIADFVESVFGQVQFKFKCSGYHQLMVVPFREMENFMLAMTQLSLKHYYQPQEFRQIKAGSKVRVHADKDNPSNGVVGILARPQGRRNKCFLVDVPGYLSASFEVQADWLEVIED